MAEKNKVHVEPSAKNIPRTPLNQEAILAFETLRTEKHIYVNRINNALKSIKELTELKRSLKEAEIVGSPLSTDKNNKPLDEVSFNVAKSAPKRIANINDELENLEKLIPEIKEKLQAFLTENCYEDAKSVYKKAMDAQDKLLK